MAKVKARDKGDAAEIYCTEPLYRHPFQMVDHKNIFVATDIYRGFTGTIGGGIKVVENDFGAAGWETKRKDLARKKFWGFDFPRLGGEYDLDSLFRKKLFMLNGQSKDFQDLPTSAVGKDGRNLVAASLIFGQSYLRNLAVVFGDTKDLSVADQILAKKSMKKLKKRFKLHRAYTKSEYEREFEEINDCGRNQISVRRWDGQTLTGKNWQEKKAHEIVVAHPIGNFKHVKHKRGLGREKLLNVLEFNEEYVDFMEQYESYVGRRIDDAPELSNKESGYVSIIHNRTNYLDSLSKVLFPTLLFTPSMYLYAARHKLKKSAKRKLSQLNSSSVTFDEYARDVKGLNLGSGIVAGRLLYERPRYKVSELYGTVTLGLGRAQDLIEEAVLGQTEQDVHIRKLGNSYLARANVPGLAISRGYKAYMWMQETISGFGLNRSSSGQSGQ